MFNFLKTRRIVCIGNKFIPQYKSSSGDWYSFDTESGVVWRSSDYQLKYCAKTSLKEAEDVLNSYKVIYYD